MKNIVILIFCILLNKIMDIYSPNFFIFYQLIKIQSNVFKKNKKIFCNNKVNYLPNVIF